MIKKIILLSLSLALMLSGIYIWFSREDTNIDDLVRKSLLPGTYAKLSEGFTRYELTGPEHAPVVVLIHGGTIPLCIFDPQIASLNDAGFRVLRYDQYGRGYSSRPERSYSRELFSQQLHELLEYLELHDQVHLVGPSFGGAIAVSFAARYPQRVKSLALVSPVLNLLSSDSPIAKPIKLVRFPVIGRFLFRTVILGKMIDRGRPLIAGKIGSACDSIFFNQFRFTGTERGILSMFHSDAYGDYRAESKLVGSTLQKILLIRGKLDAEVTPAMLKVVRADMPESELVEIEQAGHSPGTDNIDLFNNLLIDFFNR